MSVDLADIRVRAPAYPEETPYWPCAYFVHGDEIVAVLFFDDADDGGGGLPVDERGVVDRASPLESTGHAVGWSLHLLAEDGASADDPRVPAPDVEVWGDDLTMPEAMERTYVAVMNRAKPQGLTFEQSRERLAWRPEGGW